MSNINIDIKNVRATNYAMPAISAKISGAKRSVGLLRWRIPEEIQKRKEIKQRMDDLYKELALAEEELNEVYEVVNNCLFQYTNMENEISENAKFFD